MRAARHSLLAALLTAGCGGDGDERGSPPPADYAWLGTRYVVTVEVLSTDCRPGGLPAQPYRLSNAAVFQDGLDVVWTQTPREGSGRPWELEGTLERSNDLFSVLLRGERVVGLTDGDAECQATLALPAAFGAATCERREEGAAPPPEAPRLELVLDQCGSLRGEGYASLVTTGDACRQAECCTMHLRWTATEAAVDPRKPDDAPRSARPCFVAG